MLCTWAVEVIGIPEAQNAYLFAFSIHFCPSFNLISYHTFSVIYVCCPAEAPLFTSVHCDRAPHTQQAHNHIIVLQNYEAINVQCTSMSKLLNSNFYVTFLASTFSQIIWDIVHDPPFNFEHPYMTFILFASLQVKVDLCPISSPWQRAKINNYFSIFGTAWQLFTLGASL